MHAAGTDGQNNIVKESIHLNYSLGSFDTYSKSEHPDPLLDKW